MLTKEFRHARDRPLLRDRDQDLFGDHPPPHFHAVYGEYVALIAIDSLKIIEGDLPPRAQEMVIEWARQHQAELIQMWHEQSFRRLAPLE